MSRGFSTSQPWSSRGWAICVAAWYAGIWRRMSAVNGGLSSSARRSTSVFLAALTSATFSELRSQRFRGGGGSEGTGGNEAGFVVTVGWAAEDEGRRRF